ncbi:MAG TPA: hypothetical protein DCQ26_16625 [Marinilabiliales bacterium]|jgi:hypothetical protein|nr:hypothetical protein [Salinivirgaceae bacterium]OFX37696.1 MAG: hypothetical protein A2W95_00830 [Bacteroidetes bacterium GWA2_40_14]OFX59323.1 MAG: hypothetical protein A2W84_02425 [Bacteroidetes bacterium GWC2_40_13]OFX74706.1 MAG: hypothetical protein A2W96_04375 [Bacteroidetes bacterium GWD2_40_43]OFX88468.1 MAG: hypothetical protein A2W97_09610 [Bacteroidetes bacterium GWE2_40_63]OFY22626.1 MAG: hypothetical protein A2W88_11355 [Bacteroidetes bacterium GWF2_40_13]OFZ29560.1 MAG: hypot
MKKLLSISFAFLILLSGMHFSIAVHICSGEIAASKWSITGQKATCGMESPEESCPMHTGIDSNCCHDKIACFVVDTNYSPTSFQDIDVNKKVSRTFDLPVTLVANSIKLSVTSYLNIRPPDKAFANEVFLSKICILRI